mgnify:CR=1 FL=1
MQSISSYINPNTRGLTSNYKNTAIKDKETYNEAMSQHLLNPVEDLVQVLKTPIKLAKSSSLSRQNNSVNIAEGQRIRVNGGHVLTVTAHGVEVSGGDNPYDTQSYVKAQRMAEALASMLRNAGGTMTTVAHSKEEYARYTEGITDVMSYLGIDTSKDFTVNGMKYSKNKDGWYESEANSDAQAAYEQLKANNRTYQFADEKTKKQIAYISDYYLQTVPESVKAAWQETLEETGVNPFQTDLSSTLTQLSVEQDFQTGGNDNIFGETKESCLAAINKILERIENPLAAVTDERAAYKQSGKPSLPFGYQEHFSMPLSIRLHYPRLLPMPDPTRHDISQEYLHIYSPYKLTDRA